MQKSLENGNRKKSYFKMFVGLTYFEFDMHRLHISEIIPDYAKHF